VSLFAGIMLIDPVAALPSRLADAIAANLSRHSDPIDVYNGKRVFLAKINVGAFDSLGLHKRSNGGVLALAGEPLYMASDTHHCSREENADALAVKLKSRALTALADCYGSYALAFVDALESYMVIATDNVGVRPLYYFVGDRYLIFSTSLRVLESLDLVPKRADMKGLTEQVSFGFPLGNRTPYADIKILRNGEALVWDKGVIRTKRYFRWQQAVSPTTNDLESLLDHTYQAFISAVACRSSRDNSAISFLSGGLDSRTVVAALRELGKRAISINFLRPGRLDTTLAERCARAAGTQHMRQTIPLGEPQAVSKGRVVTRMDWSDQTAPKPGHTQLVFSGDGGSVGFGHVYMYDSVVEAMRAGRIEAAVNDFIAKQRNALGTRMFLPSLRSIVGRIPAESIKAELATVDDVEPGRQFHLFLVENDVRRHLHQHYEDLDEYRVEYLTPFYDHRVLQRVLSAPVDLCMKHAYYYRWLERFPEWVRHVPWQAYPGHFPCPIQEMSASQSQWKRKRSEDFYLAAPHFRQAFSSCWRTGFPSPPVSRWRLAAALGAHATKMRNYGYLFRTFLEYRKYLAKCQGVIVWDD